ncbi:efflux RND transporter permease subunit [Candidatus Magnetaquicoccus inordinatus]|uniref:efflux RND transporter permease subunit n=1 Tax=Candidatus Magnetaquicoccus inordinatus TaxID=2496818 RepID=UPI00102C1387|nr:efflux RND transporter permease subunit [Candidatus Magnetaquicoccus inordinatus]
MSSSEEISISGRIAGQFQNSAITPLLGLVGLLLGLFAVLITPQEEEPQISVTFANIFIAFPGASSAEVEQLVSTPAEQILSEVEGVKHVYSTSRPGMSIVTVQFEVGQNRNGAILRLYNAIFSNEDFLPRHLGVMRPLVKPKGIDDVPIVTFTLWSDHPQWGGYELAQVAHALEAELKRVPNTRDVYTVGAPDRVVHVLLDPQKLAAAQLSLEDLSRALNSFNTVAHAGSLVSNNQQLQVQAGEFLQSVDEVADLVIAMRNGQPIYLHEVAKVSLEADQPDAYVWYGTGPGSRLAGEQEVRDAPAVTLAVAKKPGANAAEIARNVIERMQQLQGHIIPEDVHYTVTRDYGVTAAAKASKLIGKLAFATFFVVLLVLFTMGWREASIVGVAVILTLALTLFANWAWGFTLNRVSLFALIFSIGILVDDAIVVVENIHRHMHGGHKPLLEIIPQAVHEIGGPTILATLTVISALLPMTFVSGLMGPYMSPIPINASIGMLLSLCVAFVVTPWLAYQGLHRLYTRQQAAAQAGTGQGGSLPHKQADAAGQQAPVGYGGADDVSPALLRFFQRIYLPFLTSKRVTFNRLLLAIGVFVLIALSLLLVSQRLVILKMLPFDNKSELQIVVDMPQHSTLQQTARVMSALTDYLAKVPEVANYQAYVGISSPPGFNGLVRQYYLRKGSHVGDIQINIVDKQLRERKSHQLALDLREPLQAIAKPLGANIKIVEVPPGPPVQSPLVVEVYGPDLAGQRELARRIEKVFQQTADIVDVDSSVEQDAERLLVQVDRQRAAQLGLSQAAVTQLLSTVLHGQDLSYIHSGTDKYATPIRVESVPGDKASLESLLALQLMNTNGALIPLADFVSVQRRGIDHAIYHKDLLRVVYVTGDMAGKLDSPLYGMAAIHKQLANMHSASGALLKQYLFSQPATQYDYAIKWDGEWQITFETFRDMGIAYSVGLLMIYLLVVAQFRSYLVPLVIMAPIPLTVIGVMPGHALLGAQFTATSMIGMIALAGIIVRNSILLVDFVNETMASGVSLAQAVILSGAIRSKPILLTGLAAMLGAFFIIDDPIFSGLAIVLIFGIFISTMLTLWIIPILYFALVRWKTGKG